MTLMFFIMTSATFIMTPTDTEGYLPDAYRPKRASVSFDTYIRALRYEHPRHTLRAAIHTSHGRHDYQARTWDDEKIGK